MSVEDALLLDVLEAITDEVFDERRHVAATFVVRDNYTGYCRD